MDFQRVPGPIGDPFFDAVHDRHPDARLVVLPPDADGVTEQRSREWAVGAHQVSEVVESTRVAASRLWSEMTADLPGDQPAPEFRGGLRHATGDGNLEAFAKGRLRPTADGMTALDRLEATLRAELDTPWRVRRHEGPVSTLTAARGKDGDGDGDGDGPSVHASYAHATGVLLLTCTSVVLHVTDAEARDLVRGG